MVTAAEVEQALKQRLEAKDVVRVPCHGRSQLLLFTFDLNSVAADRG